MRKRLKEYNVSFVTCGCKPYNVDRYEMRVPMIRDLYETMSGTCVSLMARGTTVLMFLPGKAEIIAMKGMLMGADVDERNIFILHSELSETEIDKAKRPTSRST